VYTGNGGLRVPVASIRELFHKADWKQALSFWLVLYLSFLEEQQVHGWVGSKSVLSAIV